MFRTGLIQLINEDPVLEVVAEARTAESAWELIQSVGADVVVSDCDLPDESGLELCRQLQQLPDPIPVVLFTVQGAPEFVDARCVCWGGSLSAH